MKRRLCVLSCLVVLLSLSFMTVVSVTPSHAMRLSLSEIQFDALATGGCLIQYGVIGEQGTPNPVVWQGVGEGRANIRGIAENVDPNHNIPGVPIAVAYSNDIDATGGVSVSWAEEGGKHRLNVNIYSNEATEGIFLPCHELFSIPQPGLSNTESLLEFRATYVSDSQTRTFSGKAFFNSGMYGPIQGTIMVLLFDIDSNTMYSILWLCRPTPAPGFDDIPAAEVFKSNVQTGEPIDYQALPAIFQSQSSGTNDRGIVVGWSQVIVGINPQNNQPIFQIHAFLWTEQGEVVDLGTLPGYTSSRSKDVNDKGEVVGYSSVGSVTHAFLWTEKDGMVDLGTLPGHTCSQANAINNLGYIVGSSYDPSPTPPFRPIDQHACMWAPNGTIIGLSGTIGLDNDAAYGINNLNQVVGADRIDTNRVRAFLWTMNEGMRDLGTLPGGIMSVARGINDRGMVVGGAQTQISPGMFRGHAFLWTEKDGMVDLGTLPGQSGSQANAINNLGTIIGTSGNPGPQHACMWTKNGEIIDLHPIFPNIYQMSAALGINENGKIVGWWYFSMGSGPGTFPYYCAGVWDVSDRAD